MFIARLMAKRKNIGRYAPKYHGTSEDSASR
jgi:hypothetical protein